MKETKLWINGKWKQTNNTYELKAPYTGEVIAKVSKATVQDVEQAIEGAHAAFLKFKAVPAYERAEILYKVVEILRKRKNEFASILADEAGKPLKAGLVELERTIATYQFSAEAAKQSMGETVPMDAAPGITNRIGFTKRVPLGVVSAITPFNFPFNLVAHKFGSALVVGNAVVNKFYNSGALKKESSQSDEYYLRTNFFAINGIGYDFRQSAWENFDSLFLFFDFKYRFALLGIF